MLVLLQYVIVVYCRFTNIYKSIFVAREITKIKNDKHNGKF